MIGSSEIIPPPQIKWLADHGFCIVIPNYRLAPQVNGNTIFADVADAYDWASSRLVDVMKTEHGVTIDGANITAMGHSSGGTLALHLASCRPVKAVTAFYPSLYFADRTTSSHKIYNEPPFDNVPEFVPTEDDWNAISPAGKQISESGLPVPGLPVPPRSKWQMHVSTRGLWMKTLCPDGNYASIDPLTRLSADWPPVMFVTGEADVIPGSGLDLVQRAEKDMKAAGMEEIVVRVLPGAGHMFDLIKPLGSEDFGPEWQVVVEGLHFLESHVKQ